MAYRTPPLTAQSLIDILSAYPPETPIFDSSDHDLFPRHVTETKYDDWDHATQTEDGEIPAVGIALSIGR